MTDAGISSAFMWDRRDHITSITEYINFINQSINGNLLKVFGFRIDDNLIPDTLLVSIEVGTQSVKGSLDILNGLV